MPAGRPVKNNQAILDEVKKDPKLLKVFTSALEDISKCLAIIEGAQDKIKRVVEDTAEATKLAKGFITNTAKDTYNGKVEANLAKAEAIHEASELLKKRDTSSSADEDESF